MIHNLIALGAKKLSEADTHAQEYIDLMTSQELVSSNRIPQDEEDFNPRTIEDIREKVLDDYEDYYSNQYHFWNTFKLWYREEEMEDLVELKDYIELTEMFLDSDYYRLRDFS